MTNSNVVSSRFPYLPIRVNVNNTIYDGDALLDTGFSGGVILPSRLLPDENLAAGYERLTLADNRQIVAPYYTGSLEVGGLGPIQTTITVFGDEAIVGVHVISLFYVLLDQWRASRRQPVVCCADTRTDSYCPVNRN